jgi:hypothetical protein
MSRRYRIQVRETLRQVVKKEDHVRSQLEMLEVLPADQMADLLAEELVRRGFERSDGSLVRKRGDVEVTVELETGAVTVRAASEKRVEMEKTQERYSYGEGRRDTRPLEKQLRQDLRESLEQEVEEQAERLQAEVTDLLEAQLGDVTAELDQAVNRATAEALKRKAAQMGRIKQMADDPESGSLTIVVEL